MDLSTLPRLGVGIGYRSEIDAPIAATSSGVDWLEVISEQYFGAAGDRMERLVELGRRFPVVLHGVELSIGTEGELDPAYVDRIAHLVPSLGVPWFSDHLCFTRAEGISLGQLTPLRRTRALARRIARKARELQERVGAPFLLENITYYVDLAGELSEPEFLSEVVEHADCGILLDLTNLFINSVNHRFDAVRWLEAIPLERIVQLHIAGGQSMARIFADTHGSPVHDEVFGLLEAVAGRMPNLKGILLERDQNYPADFGELLAELDRARRLVGWGRRGD